MVTKNHEEEGGRQDRVRGKVVPSLVSLTLTKVQRMLISSVRSSSWPKCKPTLTHAIHSQVPHHLRQKLQVRRHSGYAAKHLTLNLLHNLLPSHCSQCPTQTKVNYLQITNVVATNNSILVSHEQRNAFCQHPQCCGVGNSDQTFAAAKLIILMIGASVPPQDTVLHDWRLYDTISLRLLELLLSSTTTSLRLAHVRVFFRDSFLALLHRLSGLQEFTLQVHHYHC